MDEMTIGEISRSLARLEKSQGEQTIKLDVIKEQTLKTNGFVARHEERLKVLESKESTPKTVVVPEGESLSIKISPKMWAGIVGGVSALSIAAPKIGEWIEKFFAGK